MAAAPSPEKTRPRLTAALPIWRATPQKNVVAAGLAQRCEIGVAYAIGVAHPVSIYVDTFGTGITDDSRIAAAIEEIFDFRPAAIIEALGLRRPIYAKTAAYGHFGRNDLPWEQTDRMEALKAALKI